MKILYILWNFYPNTALTNHAKATIKGFNESGASCKVLSVKPLSTKDDDSVNILFTGVHSFAMTLLGMIWNVLHLIILSRKYDCLYCATGDLYITKLCLLLAKLLRKKVVHERTEFPDLFYPISTRGRRNLKKYLNASSSFDAIFCISNPIRDYFIENGVDGNKIHIYPMIVDPSRFEQFKKTENRESYIAYCGNLKDAKDGVSDLITAYGMSKIAKGKYELLLIGRKPNAKEMQKYEKLIDIYKLNEKVIFYGEVSREDMPQILKNAKILVLCRPDNRQALGGVPTKLGEYLSTGNPVLVTAVGDIRLYLKDGVNAYVSRPQDINTFSQKIDEIASNYECALKVGNEGKRLVYDDFNYLIQTKKILNIIQNI